jgi:hypothetical protein
MIFQKTLMLHRHEGFLLMRLMLEMLEKLDNFPVFGL